MAATLEAAPGEEETRTVGGYGRLSEGWLEEADLDAEAVREVATEAHAPGGTHGGTSRRGAQPERGRSCPAFETVPLGRSTLQWDDEDEDRSTL